MNLDLLRSSIDERATFEFVRSSGPGGQNVNKVNSKVVARIKLDDVIGLSPAERAMASARLGGRITGEGELIVQSDEERDQGRNRSAALARLFALIASSARLPKPRKATKPTHASRERRLSSKRARAESKALRRKPTDG